MRSPLDRAALSSPLSRDQPEGNSILDLTAMYLFGDEGTTVGTGNTLTSWQSGGFAPAEFTNTSAYITVENGIVTASNQGNGSLSHYLPAPIDLPIGFSCFACCRTPDVANIGTSKRLLMIYGDGGTPFNAFFPNTSGQVLMSTSGGIVSANGLTEGMLESFAVWGFVYDIATGTGRILRNGVTLSEGPLVGTLTGVTRYRALLNASIEVKGSLMFAGGSPEIDAGATAFLMTKYGIS